jgi:hypothetical protein
MRPESSWLAIASSLLRRLDVLMSHRQNSDDFSQRHRDPYTNKTALTQPSSSVQKER